MLWLWSMAARTDRIQDPITLKQWSIRLKGLWEAFTRENLLSHSGISVLSSVMSSVLSSVLSFLLYCCLPVLSGPEWGHTCMTPSWACTPAAGRSGSPGLRCAERLGGSWGDCISKACTLHHILILPSSDTKSLMLWLLNPSTESTTFCRALEPERTLFLILSNSFTSRMKRTTDVSKKNPAYGRHWISQSVRIVGPIQFWEVKWFLKKI